MSHRWDKRAARLAISAGLLSGLERLESRRKNVLRILAYHRIGDPETEADSGDPTLYSATPEQFAEQMQVLADHYAVLSVEDLLASQETRQPLAPRSVLVTFDDGYRDFAEYAWPVLARLGLPAVLFVPTDYVSNGTHGFWWDDLYRALTHTGVSELSLPKIGLWPLRNPLERRQAFLQIKSYLKRQAHEEALSLVDLIASTLEVERQPAPSFLRWQEVRRMNEAGLCIGAHTRTHPLLSRITLKEAREEIVGSQQDILNHLGRTWPIFAYPSGHPADLRAELRGILEQEGFRLAVTMIEGHNVLGRTPPLHLRRVGMALHLSLDEFRLALTGAYDVYGAWLRRRSGDVVFSQG